MNLLTNIYLFLAICALAIVYNTKNDKSNVSYIIAIGIAFAIILIINKYNTCTENLTQFSNEAIQNLTSQYNAENVTATNLTLTGVINAPLAECVWRMQPSVNNAVSISTMPSAGDVNVDAGGWNVWQCKPGEFVNGIASTHTSGSAWWRATSAVKCCK